MLWLVPSIILEMMSAWSPSLRQGSQMGKIIALALRLCSLLRIEAILYDSFMVLRRQRARKAVVIRGDKPRAYQANFMHLIIYLSRWRWKQMGNIGATFRCSILVFPLSRQGFSV